MLMSGWSKWQGFKALLIAGILFLLMYLIHSSKKFIVIKSNENNISSVEDQDLEWYWNNITRLDFSPAIKSNLVVTNKTFDFQVCPIEPPNLVGPIGINTTLSLDSMNELEHRLSNILAPGGWYRPKDCIARQRVAIVVPFRNRYSQMLIFLKHIHPFLIKQQLEYGIFVVEQTDGLDFNRASLMNVGFLEALKLFEWNCFIFHDVDLLPIDDRNLYTCLDQPRHMSVAVDTMHFRLPYDTIFGGVSAMSTEQFKTVNGFSNSFWGWGGEDDDMYNRLKNANYRIIRCSGEIARYTMLIHNKEKANRKRHELITIGKTKFHIDGLNSIKYDLHNWKKYKLFTWFLVEIKNTSSAE